MCKRERERETKTETERCKEGVIDGDGGRRIKETTLYKCFIDI